MKKVFKQMIAAALLATATTGAFAQSNYSEGDNLLNVGIGLGSTLTSGGLKSTIPPLGVSFEHGFTDKISAGGYIGYAGASQDVATYGGTWKFSYSYIVIGARGSYHFDLNVDKLDPYAGLLIGYNIASSSVEKPSGYTGPDITSASAGGVVIGGHVGARYYFNEKFAAFGELGYGIAYLTLGVATKF